MRRICWIVALIIATLLTAPAQTLTPSLRSSAEVERRADSILRQMTLEEKLSLLGGVDGFFIRDIPRLNLPRLKMADGPLGVRNFGPATAFAGGVTLTATWNPSLAELVGIELGRDARAKGVHFLLAPAVNIYRAPMNGRNFEYFGEDPFLASRMAVSYIKGVQSQEVSATIKHYLGNNSEFDRHNTDSIIDERTMREIYLPAFEAAVKEAHVGAIMSSYNLTNGQHMSQNKYLLTDVLKKEWGFDGLIMSDWSGTYDGIEATNAGQDLEMPSGLHMNQQVLKPAIEQGKVSVDTVDDKVRRILRTALRFGWLDRDQTALSIPRYNLRGREVALNAAREGITLLKNDGGLLPLSKSKIKSILVVGPGAFPAVSGGGGSADVQPFAAISYLEGLANYGKDQGNSFQVYYDRGLLPYSDLANATNFITSQIEGKPGLKAEYFDNLDLKGTPVITRTEEHVDFGTAARLLFPEQTLSSRWTGYYSPREAGSYDIFVQTTREVGGSYRLYVDNKLVLDNWTTLTALTDYRTLRLEPGFHKIVLEQHGRAYRRAVRLRMGVIRAGQFVTDNAKKLAVSADVVVVAAGFDAETEAESADRTFRLPLGQDELIQEMAAANKNTIIVMTSGGSVDMNAWLERVPALVQAWYPGQEAGTALAEILFGDVNPSGRLPVTFERRGEDNPVHDSYSPPAGTKRVIYKEGVFVGYRGYEHNRKKPLFPFGFGLSYTTFTYSNLAIKPVSNSESGPRYEVSFDVRNTGAREGADVAQVYVGATQTKVPRPAKELKGFLKVSLRPGETRKVSVILDSRALSYYDVNAKQWRAEPGDFDVLVGRSSEQIELRGKLTLATSATSK